MMIFILALSLNPTNSVIIPSSTVLMVFEFPQE